MSTTDTIAFRAPFPVPDAALIRCRRARPLAAFRDRICPSQLHCPQCRREAVQRGRRVRRGAAQSFPSIVPTSSGRSSPEVANRSRERGKVEKRGGRRGWNCGWHPGRITSVVSCVHYGGLWNPKPTVLRSMLPTGTPSALRMATHTAVQLIYRDLLRIQRQSQRHFHYTQ